MPDDYPYLRTAPSIDADVMQAAEAAAAQAGMTVSDWLKSSMLNGSGAARSGLDAAPVPRDDWSDVPSADQTWEEDDLADADRLTAVSQIVEDKTPQDPMLGSIHEELEQLRQLVQDYQRILMPAVEALQQLPDQMRELSELAGNVRASAETAHRAAATVLPLERTLLRLAEESKTRNLDRDNDRRPGNIGRLLRT